METSGSWGRVLDFVNAQAQPMRDHKADNRRRRMPIVTISRQAGAGSQIVARELVAILDDGGKRSVPWTIFDRDLMERMVAEHDLPGRLAGSLNEDRTSEAQDTLDEIFGLRPSSWLIVRKTAETILHLASAGNAIVVGRAGNVVTDQISTAFHVRLVGDLATRIEHVRDFKHLSRKVATEYVEQQDLGRRRYVRKYYGRDVGDPLLYHLVINTDRMSYREAAETIAHAMATKGLVEQRLTASRGDHSRQGAER